MEKRLFLAILLSIVVLMMYSSITAKHTTQQPILPTQSQTALISQPVESTQVINKVPIATSQAPILISLSDNNLELKINALGSGISQSMIHPYAEHIIHTNIGLLPNWQDKKFTTKDVTNGVEMGYNDSVSHLTVKKTYRLTENPYILSMVLEFINHSNDDSYINYSLNIASVDKNSFKNDPSEQRYIEFSILFNDNILRKNYWSLKPVEFKDSVKWLGIRDRYFCVIFKPLQKIAKLEKSVSGETTSFYLVSEPLTIPPQSQITHSYDLYIGPQKEEFLSKFDSNSITIINYGALNSLAHMLKGTLIFINKYVRNWGITLVIFSILAFIVLLPLSIKSFSSMRRMQELQPETEALKVKYKNDPQKLNKAIMEMYKEKKINPFSGCLPLFLQMPIFFALFQLLMRFIDLKGASFLWIKDLSRPDRAYVFSQRLPVIGDELNILPLIMMFTMLIQQWFTTSKAPSVSGSASQQKMMSVVMSIFFGFIFYRMPSGLSLYWTVNSFLMLIFQLKFVGSSSKLSTQQS